MAISPSISPQVGAGGGSDLSTQGQTSFKLLNFPVYVGAAADGNFGPSFPHNIVTSAAAQAVALNQMYQLGTSPAVRLKQASVNALVGFGASKYTTITGFKCRNGTSTQLFETTGTPGANIVGNGAGAITANQIAGAAGATSPVTLNFLSTLTDADLIVLPGDFFWVTLASTTGTPGATGIVVTFKAIADSNIEIPGAIS